MATDWDYVDTDRFGYPVDLEELEMDRAEYDAVGEIEFNMANPLAGIGFKDYVDSDQEEALAEEAQRAAEAEWPRLAESQEHCGKVSPEEKGSNKRRRKQSSPRKWVSNNAGGIVIILVITIIVPSEASTSKHTWMLTMLDGSVTMIVMIVPLVMPLLLLL